jgi:hypothetical protein
MNRHRFGLCYVIRGFAEASRQVVVVYVLGSLLPFSVFGQSPDAKTSVSDERIFIPPADAKSLGEVKLKAPVTQASLDGGTVPLSKTTTFSVEIKNPTNVPLAIAKIETSCGCMAAAHSSRLINASGSQRIYLNVTPKNTGAVSNSVGIYFDDGTSLALKFGLKVRPVFSVSREIVDLASETSSIDLEFSENFPEIATIKRVVSHNELVEVQSVELGNILKAKFDVTKFIAEKEPRLSLAVSLIDSNDAVYNVRILIRRSDRIVVTPSILHERIRRDGTIQIRAIVRGGPIKEIEKDNVILEAIDDKSRELEGVKITVDSLRQIGKGIVLVNLSAQHSFVESDTVQVRWLDKRAKEIGRTGLKLRGRPQEVSTATSVAEDR